MEARVAGVPSPDIFIAKRCASSSKSLPAVSIADNKLASVWSGLGLVCFSNNSVELRVKILPSKSFGSLNPSSSSSRSRHTLRHAALLV